MKSMVQARVVPEGVWCFSVAEHLLCKGEALSSIPGTEKSKRKQTTKTQTQRVQCIYIYLWPFLHYKLQLLRDKTENEAAEIKKMIKMDSWKRRSKI
jgi:hypothetical protein